MALGDRNRDAFGRPDVVEFYERQTDLLPEEEHVFARWVPEGSNVLDLGIGAGRTTPALSARAARYVGLDYVPEMVEATRRRFPDLDLVVGDAADLGTFDDATFDVVVFSFNGLDCLPDVGARRRCLAECRRVLRDGGTLIVSSHHPRSIRGRATVGGTGVGPFLKRIVAVTWGTVRRAVVRVPQRAFWTGEGYLYERTHGGLELYAVLPSKMVASTETVGFRLVEQVPSTFPDPPRPLGTPWFTYVFSAGS